jgi:hypothetical protein
MNLNFGKQRKLHGEESETNDEAQDRRRSWHFDKSINLPFIWTILAFGFFQIMLAMSYVQDQDRRMTREESRGDAQDKADIALKDDIRTLKGDLRDDLKRIEKKLDDTLGYKR